MAGARKCPGCGRWVAGGQSFCGRHDCLQKACPHRLTVWAWFGDQARSWTVRYLPRIVPCEVNHRTTGRLEHWHHTHGAWA